MKKARTFIGLYKAAIIPLGLLPKFDYMFMLIIFIILCILCPDPYFKKDKYYYISLFTFLGIGVILALNFHQEVIGALIMFVAFAVIQTIYWRKHLHEKNS